ncbi:EF-hand domain-containing protein [Haloferula sp. BvORR071]|uniref:EF-hand domain-containing protein n=1 Tax=Haloferula sp. BvORR071 TaxID=1396141 RepID=UPI0005558220|nr:EF-hand domain-containing protein [Haloferula sp. BvORR071]
MKYLSLSFLPLLFLANCAPHQDPNSEAAQGRKMMALLEKFDRFDYNGNGLLTRKEIEQGIKETGVQGVDAKELDAVMKYYDVTKDGSISHWEAERVLSQPVPQIH